MNVDRWLIWWVHQSDGIAIALAVMLAMVLSFYWIWESLRTAHNSVAGMSSVDYQKWESMLERVIHQIQEKSLNPKASFEDASSSITHSPQALVSNESVINLQQRIQELEAKLNQCESNKPEIPEDVVELKRKLQQYQEQLETYDLIADDIHENMRLKLENYLLRRWLGRYHPGQLDQDPSWLAWQKAPERFNTPEAIDRLLEAPPSLDSLEISSSTGDSVRQDSSQIPDSTEVVPSQQTEPADSSQGPISDELIAQLVQATQSASVTSTALDDNVAMLNQFDPDSQEEKKEAS